MFIIFINFFDSGFSSKFIAFVPFWQPERKKGVLQHTSHYFYFFFVKFGIWRMVCSVTTISKLYIKACRYINLCTLQNVRERHIIILQKCTKNYTQAIWFTFVKQYNCELFYIFKTKKRYFQYIKLVINEDSKFYCVAIWKQYLSCIAINLHNCHLAD